MAVRSAYNERYKDCFISVTANNEIGTEYYVAMIVITQHINALPKDHLINSGERFMSSEECIQYGIVIARNYVDNRG